MPLGERSLDLGLESDPGSTGTLKNPVWVFDRGQPQGEVSERLNELVSKTRVWATAPGVQIPPSPPPQPPMLIGRACLYNRAIPVSAGRTTGEMSEWLKEHAWKACVWVTAPRVQIPLSPPPQPRGGPQIGPHVPRSAPEVPPKGGRKQRQIDTPGGGSGPT